MSGRPRMNRPLQAADNPAEATLWAQTLDALSLLPKTQDSQAHLRLQALFEEGLTEEVGKGVREKVQRQLQTEEDGLDREIAAYDQALEKLSVLLALQTASSPPGTPAASTPGPPNPPKRGRPPKNAVASRSSSISRASAPPPPPPAQPSLPPNHPANFPPVPSFHTQPLWKRDPKERKAELAAQLPLTAGRRVAFKVPVKPTGGSKADKGADAGAADEWILAIVRKIIGQDLGRYEVADADLESEGVVHNTTLKSLVPLPTVGAHIDSPAHPAYFAPHPIGSQAMAIYPGTTAFYRGIVRGRETERAPDELAGGKGKSKKKAPAMVQVPEGEQRYLVAFEDDGDQVQVIEMGDIAEWPGGQNDKR